MVRIFSTGADSKGQKGLWIEEQRYFPASHHHYLAPKFTYAFRGGHDDDHDLLRLSRRVAEMDGKVTAKEVSNSTRLCKRTWHPLGPQFLTFSAFFVIMVMLVICRGD